MKRNLLFFLVIFLSGCSISTVVNHIPSHNPEKLVVFFDGTRNDESSNTNIKKLHSLITLQNKTNISTTYIKGVGTGKKIIGAGLGWGIGHDVREAYRYLGENYTEGDEIIIFGFSRGAYAARILAAFVHMAGVVDLRTKTDVQKVVYVKKLYNLYKGSKSIEAGKNAISKFTGIKVKQVRIKFMGLFDTVEALGLPDFQENNNVPNIRYTDQLCNIDKASHALSIDDDRARIFTPILLTREHLIKQCLNKVDINNTVEEVWFSGAHSDVGGGYDDTDIDGVSLNWMLDQIDKNTKGLLPTEKRVYADPYGKTHDPEAGLFGLVYRKRNRNMHSMNSSYNQGKLKIHRSVIERLACVPIKDYEFNWYENYPYLFERQGDTLKYKKDVLNNSFEIVDDGYIRLPCNTHLPVSKLRSCKTRIHQNLRPTEGCYVDVFANVSENMVGLQVKKGESYTVKTIGDQKWKDASRVNTPLCGEKGSFLMNFFGNKKVQDSLWFSVIVQIKDANKYHDLCKKNTKVGKFFPETAGKMIIYVNDDKKFYRNNSGVVRLEIYRDK